MSGVKPDLRQAGTKPASHFISKPPPRLGAVRDLLKQELGKSLK